MTQPAKRNHKDKVARLLKQQLWVLFILIILAWCIDFFYATPQQLISKSVALGGLLNYISQAVFTWFTFRYTGYQARRHIVQQLYRGQLIKWLITLSGFALIFITIRPLSAPTLFIGFMVMQISQSCMLWRLQ